MNSFIFFPILFKGYHYVRVPDTTIKVQIQQLSTEEGVVGIIDAMSEAEKVSYII
jgi:hypothetical protein